MSIDYSEWEREFEEAFSEPAPVSSRLLANMNEAAARAVETMGPEPIIKSDEGSDEFLKRCEKYFKDFEKAVERHFVELSLRSALDEAA